MRIYTCASVDLRPATALKRTELDLDGTGRHTYISLVSSVGYDLLKLVQAECFFEGLDTFEIALVTVICSFRCLSGDSFWLV